MSSFPEFVRIPLADWIDAFMDWLLNQFAGLFDAIGDILLMVLLYIERFFLWLPWWLAILLVGVASWWIMRNWWMGLIMAGLLVLIGSFGYWELAMMTLGLTTAAVIVSLAVGIPVGIIMAKSDLVESIIRPILDAMQTMPSFVYLIPALMLFGLGKVPALFATLIYAVPPVIRLTNVGINQTTMMALAMVVIASMIGARGLGLEVLLAISRIEVGRGFEAGISIVFLAIIIDRLTHALAARQEKMLTL